MVTVARTDVAEKILAEVKQMVPTPTSPEDQARFDYNKLHPSEWAAQFHNLDDWQKQVLDSPSKRLLLCCSRQAGKSAVTAMLAAHTCIHFDNALVLMVSRSFRQAMELHRTFSGYLKTSHVRLIEDTKTSCELNNGSR